MFEVKYISYIKWGGELILIRLVMNTILKKTFFFIFFSLETLKKTFSGTVIDILSVCVTIDTLVNIVDNFLP